MEGAMMDKDVFISVCLRRVGGGACGARLWGRGGGWWNCSMLEATRSALHDGGLAFRHRGSC